MKGFVEYCNNEQYQKQWKNLSEGFQT